MRFFNKLGNVAFSQLFTYLLQQPIKDTLCGTKVLWREDYERIAAGARLLRRLRSVRRLRPDLRRRAARTEDRRDPRALPRPHVRRDQHLALEARPAAAAHVGDRGAQDQVRLSDACRRREQRASTLARFEEHRRAWDTNAALRTLYAEWYGRIAAALPPPDAGSARRARLGARLRARLHPRRSSSPTWSRRRGTIARSAPRRSPYADASSARSCCSTCSTTCRRRAGSSPRRRACCAPAGRIVMCEPYIGPLSYPVYKFLHEEPVDLCGRSADDGCRRAAAQRSVRLQPGDPDGAVRARGRAAFERAFPSFEVRAVEQPRRSELPGVGRFLAARIAAHGDLARTPSVGATAAAVVVPPDWLSIAGRDRKKTFFSGALSDAIFPRCFRRENSWPATSKSRPAHCIARAIGLVVSRSLQRREPTQGFYLST